MAGPGDELRIDIFGKDLAWRAPLGTFSKFEATLRWNAISEATITVPGDHKRRALLAAEGARVRVRFRGETLLTGPVRQRAGSGPGLRGPVVFAVQSDFRLLHNVLGWPAPSKPITGQGDEGAYYSIGRQPAETIVKDVLRRNGLERLGLPLVLAPDLGRGALTEVTFRMHPLADRLFPAVDVAGIGVTVEMIDGKLRVDCVQPETYPNILTEDSRVIRSWSFAGDAPAATRGVIGAQGEGDQRVFDTFRDAARETAWGDVLEVFRDARDTGDGATLAMRGAEALADAAAVGSLTVELAEAGNFRVFGPKGVRPGSRVTARVGGWQQVTDTLTEVSMTVDRAGGLKLASTIGPKDDPNALIMQAISALAKGVRDTKVR